MLHMQGRPPLRLLQLWDFGSLVMGVNRGYREQSRMYLKSLVGVGIVFVTAGPEKVISVAAEAGRAANGAFG
jgi:hypothetical protein